MESNEDDNLMRRYLFLEQEMAELRKVLEAKKAATEKDRYLKNEEVVLSSDDEVQLDQEVSELNQETIIELEETEHGDDVNEPDERDSNGTQESRDGCDEDTEIEVSEESDETEVDDEPVGRDIIWTQESRDGDDDVGILEDVNETGPDAGPLQTGRRFRCQHPGCKSSFKNKDDLAKHRNVHTTRFQCQVCQKCFNSTHKLKRHLAVHSDDRPFACDWADCGRTFKWDFQMKHHRKEVHSNERPYQCDKQGCSWSFKSKEALRHHLRFVHSSLRRFKCQVQRCGRRFKTKTEVKTHMNYVHSDVRNYRCHFKDCGKTFKGQTNLINHMTVHSDDRPFQCQVSGCDKRYKRKESLTEHVKLVHSPGN